MKFNEQVIREKRTIEAVKKQFMGINGKLYLIAKNVGEPIIRQNEESNYIIYDNFWNNYDENNIRTMDENEYSGCIGHAFDGLRNGYNLEILVFDEEKLIKVFYNSRKVYEEIAGELESYYPDEEWESKIEKLYPIAEKREQEYKKQEKDDRKEKFEEKKSGLIQYLKEKWNL
jgi:hypothetical protein